MDTTLLDQLEEEDYHHKDGMVHFKDSILAATMDSPQDHHEDKVATPVAIMEDTTTDTIMEDTTTEVIERTITGETILTTSMDTEITISVVLMDTETTTSIDTGTLISIILMDTETAILEDTGTIILTTLMNTTSKEDSTVTKVMEILLTKNYIWKIKMTTTFPDNRI